MIEAGGDIIAGDNIEAAVGDVSGQVIIGKQITIHRDGRDIRIPLQRPRPAEHFTNREKELAQLLQNLQPGRVVTLCGPGGIGKSALAAEAIWQLTKESQPPQCFPDGVI